MNRIIVGTDPVLIDTYAAELLGYSIEEVPYIKIAERIGVGSSSLEKDNIVELNKDTFLTTIPKNKTYRRTCQVYR